MSIVKLPIKLSKIDNISMTNALPIANLDLTDEIPTARPTFRFHLFEIVVYS